MIVNPETHENVGDRRSTVRRSGSVGGPYVETEHGAVAEPIEPSDRPYQPCVLVDVEISFLRGITDDSVPNVRVHVPVRVHGLKRKRVHQG